MFALMFLASWVQSTSTKQILVLWVFLENRNVFKLKNTLEVTKRQKELLQHTLFEYSNYCWIIVLIDFLTMIKRS